MSENVNLREAFAEGPFEYGPTPFWFLNNDLSEDDIAWSLAEQRAKGVAGVFMHPRTGMEVEYLSDEFWERIGFAIRKCEELGMKAWIYDEYNWPSGPVGGKLIKERPEYKQVGLVHFEGILTKGKRLDRPIRGKVIAAFGVESESKRVVDLTPYVKGEVLDWTPERGEWRVAVFTEQVMNQLLMAASSAPWVNNERGYLDLLNGDAVGEFIRLTHEEYKKRFGEHFGKTIPGVFTDEPANYVGSPWRRDFLDIFKKEYRYDLKPKLHELALPVGDYVKTRIDYHRLATKLYTESFFQKCSKWCEENGLMFTGHLVMEEELRYLPSNHGSFFSPISKMHIPGIDFLNDRTGYVEEDKVAMLESPNVGPKLLASTAHAMGRQRTLCEILGGCGWKTPLETMKNVVNWAEAAGVNFINPHASFLSLKGLRKRDFPASHFVQSPWWRYYDKFSKYIARTSFLLSRGRHVADIALLFPMHTLWAEHTPRAKTPVFNALKENFINITNALLKGQYDFDYLFEELVSEGKVEVEDGKLKVNEERFSILILPPTSTIPADLAKLIVKFNRAGGNVVALGRLPQHSEKKMYDESLAKNLEEIFPGFRADQRIDITHKSGGRAIFVPYEGVRPEADLIALLDEIIPTVITPDIKLVGEGRERIIYQHRRAEEGDFYFIANASGKDTKVRADMRATGRVEMWDPETGKIEQVHAYGREGESTNLTLNLPPHRGLFLAFSGEDKSAGAIEDTDLEDVSVEGNTLRGISRAKSPYYILRGERREIPNPDLLPPLNIDGEWRFTPEGDNIMLLEPWDVAVLSAPSEGEEAAAGKLILPKLSAKAKLLLGGMKVAGGISRALRGKTRRVSITRYPEDIEEMFKNLPKFAKLFGIDPEEYFLYEMIEAFSSIAQSAGVDFGKTFPPRGSEYEMTTTVDASYIPDPLHLVFEDLGEPIEIWVNDTKVEGDWEHCFVWDRSNRRVAIQELVKVGKNKIRIRSRMPSYLDSIPNLHGIEPIGIIGKFSVKDGKVSPPIESVGLGDWGAQGFPNFSGFARYSKEVEVPREYAEKRLFLELEDVRETAEVSVNGQPAGILLWHPFKVEITDFVKEGTNIIEVGVTNTTSNLLGKPLPSGIVGAVRIVPYNSLKADLGKE